MTSRSSEKRKKGLKVGKSCYHAPQDLCLAVRDLTVCRSAKTRIKISLQGSEVLHHWHEAELTGFFHVHKVNYLCYCIALYPGSSCSVRGYYCTHLCIISACIYLSLTGDHKWTSSIGFVWQLLLYLKQLCIMQQSLYACKNLWQKVFFIGLMRDYWVQVSNLYTGSLANLLNGIQDPTVK